MQADLMLRGDSANEEIDSLMREFDRVDHALGAYLLARARSEGTQDEARPGAQWLRGKIDDWCHDARTTVLFSHELVATAELALGQMDDELLVPLAIELMKQAQRSDRPLEIRRYRRAG